MAIHDYWTKQVYFEKLKNIRNCTITFEKNLVGILGVNGSGKSTILHALACMYKPKAGTGNHNYRFCEFFTPNTHARWNGSKMELTDKYKDNGNSQEKTIGFKKESRWTPKYDRRQERYVSYIGIKTCVPIIEIESQEGKINYRTTVKNDADSIKIKNIASYVLGRNYEEYNLNMAYHRDYIGVKHGAVTYSALSMGAGEQRVFAIIEELVRAPRGEGALILIDEIDLLLHRDALRKLLEKANDLAIEKKMQVIFTTHNHSILKLDFIQFHSLYQTDDRTICYDGANPDVMHRLTGKQERPISIYVEDDLSEALVKQIANGLKIKKYVNVELYGAVSNCFTCVSSVILMNHEDKDGMLFVLDGDIHRSEDEKGAQIRKSLSGTEADIDAKRKQALNLIHQFIIPDGVKPEYHYHSCIVNIPDKRLTDEEREYKQVAQDIEVVDDPHKFLSEIIRRMGDNREVGLSKIVHILSKSDEWNTIGSEIRSVLESKKVAFNL